MTPGPIAWRDVVAWCEFHNLPGESVEFLDSCLRAMDAEYLDWWAQQAKAQTKG